jgi:DNA-binding SARP family transcriptional activator
MRFQVLGEVQAHIDGRPVDTGHLRQRHVLGVLLLHANTHMSVGRLVTWLWGDRPPAAAAKSMYAYMCRLRRCVAPGAEIARRAGGYVLMVPPDWVDVHRFRRLVAGARSAFDDARRVELFNAALELWRGQPLAGLDTSEASIARETLEWERISAELDRNDGALRCGRATSVLPDLVACAARHPLDERVATQLALALHQMGRTADALHRLQAVRSRLADDLGVDPGPMVDEMYRRILQAGSGRC